jgi:integrase
LTKKKADVEVDDDRYLQDRAGNFHYKRRVPAKVGDLDTRAPFVKMSLGTRDRAMARRKRDALETADNELWASLLSGDTREMATRRYEAAVRRAEALGYSYRTAEELATQAPLEELLRRLVETMPGGVPEPVQAALLGEVDKPQTTISQAHRIYVEEIAADELTRKSATQIAQWKKVKQRSVDNFIAAAGDLAMVDITREDALKLYEAWRKQVAPKEGRPTRSPSSGNRDLTNLKKLYDAYFSHIGEHDRQNPFARLSFSENRKRSRPPFSTGWIKTKLLAAGAFATLNAEARGIALAMVDTGARPSELCNLDETTIVLDHPVPHIKIEPRTDPDDPRETKTESSIRSVPLVGVALAVFRKHPKGFPKYRNRETQLSAVVNKYMREHELLETEDHSLYCLRHSFEDRMKEKKLDDELRKTLMGHVIDRPKYGIGGALKWRRDQLVRIVLPFDQASV